jgi:DNA end-binding protein Ku
MWSGHLKLSLVTCPVALFKATDSAKRGIAFNYINPETNSRIAMKPSDPTTGEEVSRSDLVKGYEIDKGLYVTVTEDELRDLKVESNGAIQIERFVPVAEIDRLYWG